MLSGRGSFLVAGYNTMSEEEKKKYNGKRTTQAVGVFVLFTAVYMMMLEFTEVPEGILIGILVVIGIVITVLINIHPYFKNDSEK